MVNNCYKLYVRHYFYLLIKDIISCFWGVRPLQFCPLALELNASSFLYKRIYRFLDIENLTYFLISHVAFDVQLVYSKVVALQMTSNFAVDNL